MYLRVLPEGADLDVGVTVIVNFYDGISPIPVCYKSYVSEYYCIDEFVRF
jgi:hypothetical protein